MKKIWTLIASTMLVASVAFAQDDYDSDYADQTEEQYTEQEQAEVQADEQQQAEEATENEAEQAKAEEEAAPSKPIAAPVNDQPRVQEANQAEAQNSDYAQEPAPRKENRLGFGLKVAFDYGRMYGFNEDPDNDSDNSGNPTGFGFEAGLVVCVQMIPNLYFAPEANVAYISTKHEYMDLERKYNSIDLEIPLLMRGVVAERFYITGGPQINLTLSDDTEFGTISPEHGGGFDFEEKIEQASFSFGIAAGFGINIVEGFFVDLRYYMGITELYPDVKSLDEYETGETVQEGDNFSYVDMSGARMMKFKVGISYWFI